MSETAQAIKRLEAEHKTLDELEKHLADQLLRLKIEAKTIQKEIVQRTTASSPSTRAIYAGDLPQH